MCHSVLLPSWNTTIATPGLTWPKVLLQPLCATELYRIVRLNWPPHEVTPNMYYLATLTLLGFRSYREKCTVQLEAGLNVIVGCVNATGCGFAGSVTHLSWHDTPRADRANGTGKSTLLEGLCFSLGLPQRMFRNLRTWKDLLATTGPGADTTAPTCRVTSTFVDVAGNRPNMVFEAVVHASNGNSRSLFVNGRYGVTRCTAWGMRVLLWAS